jgi:hypothetical protein
MTQVDESSRKDLSGRVTMLERLLTEGVQIVVDPSTGIVLRQEMVDRPFEFSGFRFLDSADETAFQVAQAAYRNYATPKSCNDLVLAWYLPTDKPATMAGGDVEYETVLLDMKSDTITRVPLPSPSMSPGTFSPDRKHVYVTALALPGIEMRPYIVDVTTGEAELLDFEEFAGGHAMVGALSPDGNLLQVTVLDLGDFTMGEGVGFQNFLVDIAEHKLRKLGPKMDASDFNWLQDGSGLIFEKRIPVAGVDIPKPLVCRIDLNGTVTVLFEGDDPLLIGGSTVMFRRGRRWFTRSLTGTDEKLFHGGLEQFVFPTYRAGCPYLIMCKIDSGNGNPLYRIDLKTGKAALVSSHTGLWSKPRL